MTSLPSVSIDRPSARTVRSSIVKPHSRVQSQAFQETPRSVPPQVGTHLTETNCSSCDTSEPVKKRPKVYIRQTDTLETPVSENSSQSLPQNPPQDSTTNLRPNSTTGNASGISIDYEKNSQPLPFPIRPGKTVCRKVGQPVRSNACDKATPRRDVQIKLHVLEAPALAPQYQNAPADFFPWAGNHPEDALNDQTIKTGYYDKVHVAQNEMNSAHTSIWSSLKHKSGLQILSSLFVSTFDQRQANGTITTHCTFKPPPRVTLTDTKREAWLRDLANPLIPLRRLSRTIPHGIKGKALLEQCLAKNIPNSRAVWLAKCVGANELRACKRKGNGGAFGYGGEKKWIKDWTISAEQFVEAIVESCGDKCWKDKMSYGLKLVAHLYSERLLSQDQYLTWVMTSFHGSDLDRLPIWLLVLQIHWHEFQKSRHFGRRLAEGLLEQLKMVNDGSTGAALAPLRQQLATLVRSLAASAPDCFIISYIWPKYGSTLESCADNQDPQFRILLLQISERNLHLSRMITPDAFNINYTTRERLIDMLDDMLDNNPTGFDIIQTSESCIEVTNAAELLVPTLLEWCSTIYRIGLERSYIAVRLLRRWGNSGIDLDQSILAFISPDRYVAGLHQATLHKVLAELMRSRHFSISRYLQWLMARGNLTKPKMFSHCEHDNIDLLCELPLSGLPEHVVNLRQILLKSMGVSVWEEKRTISSAKNELSHRSLGFFPQEGPTGHASSKLDVRALKGTVKANLSRWIRSHVSAYYDIRDGSKCNSREAVAHKTDQTSMTLDQFLALRCIFEDLEDYSMLADVLDILLNCDNVYILRAIIDTINYHFKVFAAIGAASGLFRSSILRLEELHFQKSLGKPLIVSLIDLGSRLPGTGGDVRRLRRTLLLHQPGSLMAACSPVSDHVADALQCADLTLADELEQLLSSGTSMDKHTLSRLFDIIMQRLEKAWYDTSLSEPTVDLYDLLPRLRSFDVDAFDKLIDAWLGRLLARDGRPELFTIIFPLVCTKSLTLSTVVENAISFVEGHRNDLSAARIAQESLSLFLKEKGGHEPSGSDRGYRYYTEQERTLRTCCSHVVGFLCHVIRGCIHMNYATQETARAIIASAGCKRLIQRLVVQNDTAIDVLGQSFGLQATVVQASNALDSMLDPTNISKSGNENDLSKVLRIANDFNVPICLLKIKALLYSSQDDRKSALGDVEAIVEALIQKPSTFQTSMWTRLLSKLPNKSAMKLHDMASERLFSALPDDLGKVSAPSLNCVHLNKHVMNALLHAIGATVHSVAEEEQSPLASKLENKISSLQYHASETRLEDRAGAGLDDFLFYVDVSLRLLAIYHAILQHPKLSQAVLASIVSSLSLLLVHYGLSSHPTLSFRIFDTIAVLSDFLSDEARRQCKLTFRDQHKLQDSRVQFLLGYSNKAEDAWLRSVSISAGPSSSPLPTSNQAPFVNLTCPLFPLRRWEMMQDATPIMGENDTSLSLGLFGTRKAVL